MFIHPHHQFPSLSCESCLLFFWPKDFNYGWIGSKMSSVLFEGFWSLFLALHFFAFPLFPTPPLVSFCVCFALCFYICFLCRFNGTFAAFIRFSSWKICGPSSSDFPCIFRRAPLAFQSIFHARASSVSIQLSMHQSTDNAQNFTSATSVFHSSAPQKKTAFAT